MNGGTTNQAGSDNFQLISMLPGNLVPAAQQLSKFSGKYLVINEDGSHFDWTGFKDSIQGCKTGNLSFDNYTQLVIHRQDGNVGKMAGEVANFFQDALSASIDVKKLKGILKATFPNLKLMESSQKGVQHFTNSSWDYNILFSVPFGPSSPEYFYSLVATMKITAERSILFGRFSLSQNFSVQISALRLTARVDFTAPGSAEAATPEVPGTLSAVTPEMLGPLTRHIGEDRILLAPPCYEMM